MIKKILFKIKEKKGAALFLTVIFLGFIFAITSVIVKIQLKELQFGSGERASNKALFAADAGLERALYNIYRETGLVPDACTSTGCFLPAKVDSSLRYFSLGNGSQYHVVVPFGALNPIVTPAGEEYIVIRSIGKFNNIERSLEMNVYTKVNP